MPLSSLLLIFLILVSQGGCATPGTDPRSAAVQGEVVQASPVDYHLGPDDVVEVLVWKNPDLSREIKVRPDGKISLPLIGDVQAAGLTAEELSAAITQELSVYYKKTPEVATIVKEVNSAFVYMLGEVANQGKIVATNGTTLLQAIALAGGFSEFASRNKIIVRRRIEGGGVSTFVFRYKDIIAERQDNITLKPGDTIIVP
jgi:polysaccharide export outer membrane protein